MTEQSRYHLNEDQISAEQEEVRAAQMDPQSFKPLYTRYYPRILSFVYQRLESRETAYDITAQVFYTALDKIRQYRNLGLPFSAWLFRIALNELNKYYRQTKSRRTINIDDAGEQALREEMPAVASAVADKELFAALQTLDPEDIMLIELRYFELRSFKELSEILGMGESALKMRVYRVLEKLRTRLDKNA